MNIIFYISYLAGICVDVKGFLPSFLQTEEKSFNFFVIMQTFSLPLLCVREATKKTADRNKNDSERRL